MNIYSSVDNTNIDKIICLFNSVWINSNKELRNKLKFYLLVDELPDNLPYIPDEIKERLNIKPLNLNNEWIYLLNSFNSTFYKKSNWCKNDMNFARFLIFNHFPEIDRFVYLDWDMIVQEDIFKLEDYYNNKENMIIAECGKETIFSNIFTEEFRLQKNYQSLFIKSELLKIKYHRGYKLLSNFIENPEKSFRIQGFNSGFYIVSKYHFEENYMRKLLKKLITVQKKYNCFNFGTQVVMNLMHVNERIYIDRSWNTLPKDDCSNIKIIHYNGRKKPWNVNEHRKIDEIWEKYYFDLYPEEKESYEKKKNKEVKKKSIKREKKIINKNLINYLINKR